jgi:drug/metabolite transporter (DMT)-like permease
MLVIPKGAWLLGIGGLFGFHFFYFIAFRLAPPIHASLLASLWPLFMILMNALIHSERLAWWHVAGAFLGFSGAALLVTGGQSIAFNPAYGLGYLCALSCALIWSAYSVLNKRYSDVPTDSVSLLCGASSLLALPIHLSLETFVLPSLNEWLVILAMGLFPMGLAFFTWDYGLKQGNLRLLGLLSYVGPLISASLLILFGQAAPGWSVGIACLLITFGALLGSGRLNGLLPFLARKADTPA